ncbi:MAG: regulatory protein RecX [Salibacteraceae bacterium]
MDDKKKYSLSEVKIKISNYCARQERCHKEVQEKLKVLGVDYKHTDHLIAYLIEHNFLNESRFAKLYARSKFNQMSWGWNKIRKGLYEKGILEYCVKEAYQEINKEDYENRLAELMEKKRNSLSGHHLEVKKKLFAYLVQKGYEYELIKNKFKEIHD